MDSLGNERRRYRRFPVDGSARLFSNTAMWMCDLIDLSMHGCMISRPDGFEGHVGGRYRVDLRLGGGVMIGMACSLARITETGLAFACEKIDLDSFARLKRLVEMNLGNSEILNRELAELSHA